METVNLKPGESHIIALRGLGSAGYQWMVQAIDPQIARVEEILHSREELTGPIAGSLGQNFKLTAIAPGGTLVRFAQRRGFEQTAKPYAIHEINLVVSAGT